MCPLTGKFIQGLHCRILLGKLLKEALFCIEEYIVNFVLKLTFWEWKTYHRKPLATGYFPQLARNNCGPHIFSRKVSVLICKPWCIYYCYFMYNITSCAYSFTMCAQSGLHVRFTGWQSRSISNDIRTWKLILNFKSHLKYNCVCFMIVFGVVLSLCATSANGTAILQ